MARKRLLDVIGGDVVWVLIERNSDRPWSDLHGLVLVAHQQEHRIYFAEEEGALYLHDDAHGAWYKYKGESA